MAEAQAQRAGGVRNDVPGILWFEFAINKTFLEEHLSQENPDPSAPQLIVQFMQQIDIERKQLESAAEKKRKEELLEAEKKKKAEQERLTSQGIRIIPQERTENATVVPPEEVRKVEDNKKIRSLQILALKVLAFTNWDLASLENSVPMPVIQEVMIELLKLAAPELVDNIHSPDMEDAKMSDATLFAVQLFHRWCVRSVVRDNFPTRPLKQGLSYVAAIESKEVKDMKEKQDSIIAKFKEYLPHSISFLEKCCNEGLPTRMPTVGSFLFPSHLETAVSSLVNWDRAVPVPHEEIRCQIAFDLGSFYFFERDYRRALAKFRTCKETQLIRPVYCKIDQEKLRGYMVSCSSLLGSATDVPPTSMFDRAEATRKKDFQGIVAIFQEDNLWQELTMAYRTSVQDELINRGLHQLHVQVCLCNIVRTVVEGKAVVSPVLEALSTADEEVHKFLVQILSDVMKGASQTQRSNLKCFIWHLIELLPPESAFSRLVVASDLAIYFNEGEMAEMAVEDLDSDNLYLQDLGMDIATAPTSYPSTRESSYNASDVEGQLLAVYDPRVIEDLLKDLYENRGLHPSQIIALNDRWKVPKEIRQGLEYLPDAEFKQAYVFVLVAKARHCMDLSLFERARTLLEEANRNVADLSYVLSKHVRWQILLADLLQYFQYSEAVGDAAAIDELIKKTKTCLTTIRLGQDIQPSAEVLEQCTAFLLNIRNWDYLSNLQNTANGYIEISRMMASLCKELSNFSGARKPARELWDIVLNIYQNQVSSSKRSATGRESAMQRERESSILPRDAFLTYIQRIKEVTVLSLLISCFTKLFNILRNDGNHIPTDYVTLFPMAVSSTNLTSTEAVQDTLKTLMMHALKVNPSNPNWLKIQAEIYFLEGQHSTAMKLFLEAGVVATDFFSVEVTRSVYDNAVYDKMVQCCSALHCHTQAAILCQFFEKVNYDKAFAEFKQRTVYDAMDAYYCCIWDVTMLEFLVSLHKTRGEMDKLQCAMRALSQMDINASNPEEIRRRAKHVRKTKFLRALAKQYMA